VTLSYCPECLKKQRIIDDLKEEVARLKARLRYQERTAKEGAFGLSTPSSKVPVKPDSLAERQARRGGGRKGHAGHGRQTVAAGEADRVETVPVAEVCPDCGKPMTGHGVRTRSVIDGEPFRIKRIVYLLIRRRCTQCGRTVTARAPKVLPKSLYGNRLLSQVAVQHYVYGTPLRSVARQMGLRYGGLVAALHHLARLLQGAMDPLREAYRAAPVKHADETGWRSDGQNGYAWLFVTTRLSLYRFRRSRSAAVVKEVFGTGPVPGVLEVDRYSAYNQAGSPLQYCYEHLLRDLKAVEEKFPEQAEVRAFVGTVAPLLAAAMGLRSQPISDRRFYREAAALKRRIVAVMRRPARHPAVQEYQTIFREKADRLYHWADDRAIPAENNFAERELRPLVVARKVSFGSQSEAGARTREVLMSVLLTLKKRTPDVTAAFLSALDRLAEDPGLDPYRALFSPDTS
jgi:transposase